jgi:sterol desaturase/sphingolipid hydroxylase (fatty acid hydroxylase superfamily)
MYFRIIFYIVILGTIFLLERLFPFFKGREHRMRHAVLNWGIAFINALLFIFLFSVISKSVSEISDKYSFGLIHHIKASYFIKIIVGFLIFDLWMYLWHFANHRISFLWRFHRMHHSDMQMDSTTALRFHPGEVIFSSILRLLIVMPLLGMSLHQWMFYEVIFLPIIVFHHSNVGLKEKWDRILRCLIVTPNMHRVHHSQESFETNSNFSSVFSFWDRIFHTFIKRTDTLTIKYGLTILQEKKWQTFFGMIITPFH